MKRTAAITGALLITATMLTACSGGSDVPEVDAVEDSWEQAGSEFRAEVCNLMEADNVRTRLREQFSDEQEDQEESEGGSEESLPRWEAIELLSDETLERYPDKFSERDIRNSSQWFLTPALDDALFFSTFLLLERGLYYNALALETSRENYNNTDIEMLEELGLPVFEPPDPEEVASDFGVPYLGLLDPGPNPCTD